jgi:hypothetical protein
MAPTLGRVFRAQIISGEATLAAANPQISVNVMPAGALSVMIWIFYMAQEQAC